MHLALLSFLDTQTLQQRAQDYTPERVGQFLKDIGLGQHVAVFKKKKIGGEMLVGTAEEKLEELGVTSAAERRKIKVQWKAVAIEK